MSRKSPASSSQASVSSALQSLSQVPGAAGGQDISPARKRFDRLLRDLQKHRAQLHAWREAVDRWRARYLDEVVPLLDQHRALEIEQIHLLDNIAATVKLSKTDREFVSDEICDLAGPLIDDGHVALKPIYERHSEIGYDEEMSESDAMMKHVIGQMYGLDPEEVEAVDSPEELFERINARLDQAQADAESAGLDAIAGMHAREELEHAGFSFRSDADAGIAHRHVDPIIPMLGAQRDGAARRRVLRGIV